MTDTPNTPVEGAAVEVPEEWDGLTDTEKDAVVDALLTDVADRAGIEGTADDEPEETDPPRRFVDPDSVDTE